MTTDYTPEVAVTHVSPDRKVFHIDIGKMTTEQVREYLDQIIAETEKA